MAKEKIQKTDNWYILKANAKGWLTIWGKADASRGANYAVPLLAITWLVTLPLTLTIGAGIKTLIDIKTRKKIPQREFENTLEKINTLNDEQLDNVTHAIKQYHKNAKSNSSNKLCEALETKSLEEEQLKFRQYQQKENQIVSQKSLYANEYLNKKIHSFKQKKNENSNEDYDIKLDVTYKISEKEKTLIDNDVKESSINWSKERREEEKKIIYNFLKNPINAGKKMQHIINDALKQNDNSISFN